MISCGLQAIFVILVDRGVLTLDYSTRFAAFGIPMCILALVLAKRGHDDRHGAIVSPSIGLVVWVILINLH